MPKPADHPRPLADYVTDYQQARAAGLNIGLSPWELANWDQWLESCARATQDESAEDLYWRFGHGRFPDEPSY
jgi:phage-related protein